jgi:hypothetical protein
VFNCSLLTSLSVINFHCEIEPANSLQYTVFENDDNKLDLGKWTEC